MFRMYVNPGCPYCQEAKDLFAAEGVPVEIVEVKNDPILNAGIAAIPALGGILPATVCFSTGSLVKIVKGLNRDELTAAIATYRFFGAKSPNPAR